MVHFHILNVPQPFHLIFFFFSHLPRAADCAACKRLKDQQRWQTASLTSSRCRQASQCRDLPSSIHLTLLHSPSFTSPSFFSPLHPPPPPLSSEVPLFILTPQPVNLRSLDGHLSAPHHRAAPCRPASRPAGLDPTAPHSLISPPAVASPGLEAGRQSAASHLFPIAPSPPSPSAWMDRELQARPGERLRGRRRGRRRGVQEGMKGKDGGTDWWRDRSTAEPRALLPCERRRQGTGGRSGMDFRGTSSQCFALCSPAHKKNDDIRQQM